MPKISLLITTYKRPHLLKWGLSSMLEKKLPRFLEIIILNDGIKDETENLCKQFIPKLPIRYIFTGQRNLLKEELRPPGFAFNIGFKQSTGEIIILSCAEMFHLNNAIVEVIKPVLQNPKQIGIPNGRDDWHKKVLTALENEESPNLDGLFDTATEKLNNHLPFFMALHRTQYEELGGYDEDFTGIGFEDNDFVHRLLDYGCPQIRTKAKVIHLWHQRYFGKMQGREHINRKLFEARRGKLKRNQGKEWGVL